jgi:hypothetical protein
METMEKPSSSTKVAVDRSVLEKREAALQRLRQRFAHIPDGVSLADELIAERRTETPTRR